MSFKDFMKELNGERVEGELVKTIFYSLMTSFVVLAILYFLVFKSVENFTAKYAIYLFLSALSYALILASVRQTKAYEELPCMAGMMIGMTIGMISGFLLGFYVGSTNGMFVGSVFGMLVGISFGIWNGKCCGIMGIMEGIMAGFMGGLMGAMTAVMLINDNLKIMSIVVFLVSALILFGLNYMIYKETAQMERKSKEDYFLTIVLTFILLILTIAIMLIGPKSLLFRQ